MQAITTIKGALISVFSKVGIAPMVEILHKNGVVIYSTGGTYTAITEMGIPAVKVEDLTGFPEVFGGRVKTLHPKVFGGILYRRDNQNDIEGAIAHGIPAIDLLVVDLYPFSDTVAEGHSHEDIIEKIDIGGISLIRAAAKNYDAVGIISSQAQYSKVTQWLTTQDCGLTLAQRKTLATEAFLETSGYDSAIFNYLNAKDDENIPAISVVNGKAKVLRYGENPHQSATFFGHLDEFLQQLHGKDLSYNNLVDTDAAVQLLKDFDSEKQPFFAIIKHTNACGASVAATVKVAYQQALAADPTSAFGGVLVTNSTIDLEVATEMNKLFFEVLIAPYFTPEALSVLQQKKNRVLLAIDTTVKLPTQQIKTLLNGYVQQSADNQTESALQFTKVTNRAPSDTEIEGLVFAAKLAKHTKSNTIVLAKGKHLISSGVGQTSRIDALLQAIEKAKNFGFSLDGAVMASDAFFPFNDCVTIAQKAGITAVVQPGGSIKDVDSINACNTFGMAMVTTGIRHFKH